MTDEETTTELLNPPVGKFPALQERLRAHLQSCYLRCDHATRQIMQTASERAEMFEHMQTEVKEGFNRDQKMFNSMEG